MVTVNNEVTNGSMHTATQPVATKVSHVAILNVLTSRENITHNDYVATYIAS